ncbi:hypothetical protein T265_12448, partial [Opisthorchis viverrini]
SSGNFSFDWGIWPSQAAELARHISRSFVRFKTAGDHGNNIAEHNGVQCDHRSAYQATNDVIYTITLVEVSELILLLPRHSGVDQQWLFFRLVLNLIYGPKYTTPREKEESNPRPLANGMSGLPNELSQAQSYVKLVPFSYAINRHTST